MPRQDWFFYVPQRVRSSLPPVRVLRRKNQTDMWKLSQSIFAADIFHTPKNIRDEGGIPCHPFYIPTLNYHDAHNHSQNQQRSGGAFYHGKMTFFFFHSSIKTEHTPTRVYAKTRFSIKSRAGFLVCVLASIFLSFFTTSSSNRNKQNVVCSLSWVILYAYHIQWCNFTIPSHHCTPEYK